MWRCGRTARICPAWWHPVIHRLSGRGNHDPRLAWQVAQLIRRVRPSLVQAWFLQMEVLAGVAARVQGIPWILSERSSRLAYPPTWKNRLRVRLGRWADGIISNSEGGDAYWRECIAPNTPRFVIPNALPLDDIDAAAPALPPGVSIPRGQQLAVAIGRFEHEKTNPRLLDALRDVVSSGPVTALLCGEGPLRQPTARRVEAWELADRVLLPGYVADVWPLLKRADVLVAAGLFEGRPNAVLEAMAAGCPIVVSDIPAHREVLGDDEALWVDPANSGAITEAVRRALADPGASRARADRARRRVRDWALEPVARQYDRAYRQLLSRGALPGPLPRP
jgi:glycosyltransferase involved in cell wall biosynthesis